jgi:hypothetical protein
MQRITALWSAHTVQSKGAGSLLASPSEILAAKARNASIATVVFFFGALLSATGGCRRRGGAGGSLMASGQSASPQWSALGACW